MEHGTQTRSITEIDAAVFIFLYMVSICILLWPITCNYLASAPKVLQFYPLMLPFSIENKTYMACPWLTSPAFFHMSSLDN